MVFFSPWLLGTPRKQVQDVIFVSFPFQRFSMASSSQVEKQFPIGQRVSLPGHFSEPVSLEAARAIGSVFECGVRLADGTPDEAVLSPGEAAALIGATVAAPNAVQPADAEKIRLLVESAVNWRTVCSNRSAKPI